MIQLKNSMSFADGLSIGVVKLKDISLDPNNPRRHGAVVRELVTSIERYGYIVPIVVDLEGLILAGHARYKALKRLQVKECSCILLEKSQGYNLVDNAVGDMAGWDFERLGVELRSLESMQGLFQGVDRFFEQLVHTSIDLDSEGQVTSKDVKSVEKFLGGSEHDKAGKNEEDLVKVVCGGCGEVFYIKRRCIDYVK